MSHTYQTSDLSQADKTFDRWSLSFCSFKQDDYVGEDKLNHYFKSLWTTMK